MSNHKIMIDKEWIHLVSWLEVDYYHNKNKEIIVKEKKELDNYFQYKILKSLNKINRKS
jgi:hypothetical protein